jgi:hypothetical protein
MTPSEKHKGIIQRSHETVDVSLEITLRCAGDSLRTRQLLWLAKERVRRSQKLLYGDGAVSAPFSWFDGS